MSRSEMPLAQPDAQGADSTLHGIPLSEEPGLGALTLPGYLREVTLRFSEREALVMHHAAGSVERWSYAELWQRAMAVARALAACGVGKDSRVAVLMTNRPEWLSSVFGVGLAGGVAVPLSTFSTPAELEYLVAASGASVLLFERTVLKKDFAAMLRELEPEIGRAAPGRLASAKFPFLRRLAMLGSGAAEGAVQGWEEFLRLGRDIPAVLVDAMAASVMPSDPGVLFFSSGSTGKAKGILSAHRGVTIQCWRWRRILQLEDDVRCLSANGFFWSGNFCQGMGVTLSSGGSIVLQPTFDPVDALRLIQAERVTYAVAWPHQWAQMEAAPDWAAADLSSLRYIDPRTPLGAHPTVRTTWTEPRAAYGNTETFTISTALPANTPPEIEANNHGTPLPGNTLRILDPETGAVVPRGRIGEIAVKGPTLMLGYIGVPIGDTLNAEGFFCTGDGGYIDGRGRLVWEGRLTDIIKTGGANVSPIEVDAALEAYPGIKLSKTVGVPHDTLGELVVTCIVPHEGQALDAAEVTGFLKSRLASYKVPRAILLVEESDLSLTGSAKVKTGALRALAAARLAARANPNG